MFLYDIFVVNNQVFGNILSYLMAFYRNGKTLFRNMLVIGKFSFVNRSNTDWNNVPEGVIVTSHGKKHIFKTRVSRVKTSFGK